MSFIENARRGANITHYVNEKGQNALMSALAAGNVPVVESLAKAKCRLKYFYM